MIMGYRGLGPGKGGDWTTEHWGKNLTLTIRNPSGTIRNHQEPIRNHQEPIRNNQNLSGTIRNPSGNIRNPSGTFFDQKLSLTHKFYSTCPSISPPQAVLVLYDTILRTLMGTTCTLYAHVHGCYMHVCMFLTFFLKACAQKNPIFFHRQQYSIKVGNRGGAKCSIGGKRNETKNMSQSYPHKKSP